MEDGKEKAANRRHTSSQEIVSNPKQRELRILRIIPLLTIAAGFLICLVISRFSFIASFIAAVVTPGLIIFGPLTAWIVFGSPWGSGGLTAFIVVLLVYICAFAYGRRRYQDLSNAFLAMYAVGAVLLMVAALFFILFPPFNVDTQSCKLPSGFECNEFEVLSGGNIYLDVGQANGGAINITAFGCNSTGTTINEWNSLGANSVWIENGRHDILLNGTGPDGINYAVSQCCPATSGSACKSRIAFNYTMEGSNLTRTAYGDFGGPVP